MASELPTPLRRQKAEEAALRLLAVRERSAAEIRQRLRARGFDADTVTYVLDRLQSSGLQDDRRFAEGFAEAKVRGRGLAGRVVKGELRKMGIDGELAAQASTRSPEDELETARELAERRWRRLAAYPLNVRVRRVAGLLERRGYGHDVTTEIVERLAGEADDGEGGAPEHAPR